MHQHGPVQNQPLSSSYHKLGASGYTHPENFNIESSFFNSLVKLESCISRSTYAIDSQPFERTHTTNQTFSPIDGFSIDPPLISQHFTVSDNRR